MESQSGIKGSAPAETYVVVRGGGAGNLERYAAKELSRYLGRLSGTAVPICEAEKWARKTGEIPIAVGLGKNNPMAAEMAGGGRDPSDLEREGFILRSMELEGSSAWLVTASAGIGVLYGVYGLLEAAGATFLISGDLLPDPDPDFKLPEIDRICKPAFERRGFLLPLPLNVHESIWGMDDYRLFIDQMAKLRFNYLNLSLTGADPALEYTFNGEKNLMGDINNWETGFLTAKRFFKNGRTNQVEIGSEHFSGRLYMAPPELQGIRSPEEAHRRFKALLLGVFAHAKKRGVEIGFNMDPTEIPYNFARFMRRIDRLPAHLTFFGAKVDFTGPLFEEHTRALLKALFETYPDAVDLYFWNAEGYLDYPEHRNLIESYRPQFAESKRIFEEKWMPSSTYVKRKTAQDIIDTDIIQMEATRRIIAIARELRPNFTVGFGFLFRGYVVSSIHNIVDEDIPFMDFHSSGVIPIKDDVNAEYFAEMGKRKRYIIPRMDDDASMFGIPFYLRQFQRDGLFREAKEAGANGFVAQLFRGRGTEHHVSFLARGTWDPNLTPEQFYREYAEAVFGKEAAAAMERAFHLLEEAEELLGWRGLCNFSFLGGCLELDWVPRNLLGADNPYDGPPDPVALWERMTLVRPFVYSREPTGKYLPGRIDRFHKAVRLLDEALSKMTAASPLVSMKGRSLLDYLINKTEAYRVHLEMTATFAEGFAAYAKAFIDHKGKEAALAEALLEAEGYFVEGKKLAREAARIFARKIDHPSDLAILFLANVFNIQKADKVADLIRRVVNYHRGLPYWEE